MVRPCNYSSDSNYTGCMHVAKVMWACARDESGLTEFVVVAHTIRFISDDTMQPALDSLGGTPDSSILMQVGTSSP